MSSTLRLLLLAFLMALIATENTVMSRPISAPKSSLESRLKLDDESTECWDSLFELQACSGEVIIFFINGETNLGPACCQAIRIIEHQCWPSMLGSLGFTPEEGDILQGYCDAKAKSTTTTPPFIIRPIH